MYCTVGMHDLVHGGCWPCQGERVKKREKEDEGG